MNCKRCGAPLVENDRFCKSCGATVNGISAQNNIGGSQSAFAQYNNVQQPMNNGMGGQPVNNYQQPMNNYTNSYNSQPRYNQPTKRNNTNLVLIGVAAAVVVIVVVAVILKIALGGKTKGKSGIEPEIIVPKVEPKEEPNEVKNYTFKFEDFTFKIPTDIVCEAYDGGFILYDEDYTWYTYIVVKEGLYNVALTNAYTGNLESSLQQAGVTTGAAVEKNIGGADCIIMEASSYGKNVILAISKANSMNCFVLEVYNCNNEFDYDLLETVLPILSSAEFNDATNNMSIFDGVDLSEIIELAQ